VSADPRIVRLTIPAKAEYITLCRLALAGLSHLRPIPDETLHDLKLALTEACTNSVRHAYENGGGGQVQVVYELTGDRIAIEVADEGEGFVVDETAEADRLSESGLGIAIIRALADEPLEIERGESAGSRLRFVKHLHPSS
jgi:serine/threonine-protein kinase RsbW